MLPKFKYLQQWISEFRSEATLGRYSKSINIADKIQQAIYNLKQSSNPTIIQKLQELENTIKKQKRIVHQLQTAYPPPIHKQDELPELSLTQKYSSTISNGSKWSKHSTQKTQSYTEQNHSQKLTQEEEMYYQHLIDESNISSIPLDQYIGQDAAKQQFQSEILPPFTMPKFYRKTTKSSILIFGHQHNGKTTLIKSISNHYKLKYIKMDLLNVPLTVIDQIFKFTKQLLKKKTNHLFHFPNIDEYSQKITQYFVKMIQFHSGLHSKNLIIATSSKPMDLPQSLIKMFTNKIYLKLLETKERKQIIDHILGNTYNIKGAEGLEDITRGITSGKLTQICQDIKKHGLSNQLESLNFQQDNFYRDF